MPRLKNGSMTSKKTAGSKRATLPRFSDNTKTFTKDWVRLSRSDRFDMHHLKEVMLLLIANNEPLGPEWLDHPLAGDWKDHRECHIGGDFLLIYRLNGNGLNGNGLNEEIIFVRVGTHAELF